MKTELDISKLIQEAQELCHDGMIEIADNDSSTTKHYKNEKQRN